LALSWFPLTAGFWSKDEIIHAALQKSLPLGVLGLITALLTAFYTFRIIFIAFHGPEKKPQNVEHVEESVPWMTVPLMLLSIGAIGAGYVGLQQGGRFHEWLWSVLAGATVEHPGEAATGPSAAATMTISAVLAISGIAAAWYVYRRKPILAMAAAFALRGPYELLRNKYYI